MAGKMVPTFSRSTLIHLTIFNAYDFVRFSRSEWEIVCQPHRRDVETEP